MDRLQIIVVAKIITVLQLFISRMPKMCAIPQLVSAPLNVRRMVYYNVIYSAYHGVVLAEENFIDIVYSTT